MSFDTPEHPLKSVDFWFTDGSVVLVVQNTAFRIHHSILSKHSDVFANLFTIPNPSNKDEMFEDCPLVHLSDDLSEFTDTMKAIYEPL